MVASQTGKVVPFRSRAGAGTGARRVDQKAFLDAVYAATSLPVPAGDEETKLVASRLQVFGFIVIDEVTSQGTLRRLRPSESMRASPGRPWRVSKPRLDRPFAISIPETDEFLFEAPAAGEASTPVRLSIV